MDSTIDHDLLSNRKKKTNYSMATSLKQFLLTILATVVIDGFMTLKGLEASIILFP